MKQRRATSLDVSQRKGLPVLDDPGLQEQQDEFHRANAGRNLNVEKIKAFMDRKKTKYRKPPPSTARAASAT
jgi:hypothetical protein